jgi:hypothetical protein
MKRIGFAAIATSAVAFALLASGTDESSAAGLRRCERCEPGGGVYVYPHWRRVGWGFSPRAAGNRPFAHYPFWRGRHSVGGIRN